MPDVKYSPTKESNYYINLLKHRGSLLNLGKLKSAVRIKSAISSVFRISTASGKYIIKISPAWFRGSLKREAFCYFVLEENKIPHARLINYFPVRNNFIDNEELLVLQYIEGQRLKLSDFSDFRKMSRIFSAYEALHKIHGIGYGWFKSNFVGQEKSWLDFLIKIDNVDLSLKSGYVKKEEINFLLEQIKKHLPVKDLKRKACLLYGDFNPQNFIQKKDGKIIPLDFQSCFWGHDLYDYGIGLTYNDQMLKLLKIFKKDINERLLILYAIRNILTRIGHDVYLGDKERTRKNIKRSKELLLLYEHYF